MSNIREAVEQPSHDQRQELNDDSIEMEFEGGSNKGGRSDQKVKRKTTNRNTQRS